MMIFSKTWTSRKGFTMLRPDTKRFCFSDIEGESSGYVGDDGGQIVCCVY
jgi:hypothetical protein